MRATAIDYQDYPRQQQQPQASARERLASAQTLPERTPRERRAKNLALVGFSIAAMLVIFIGAVFGMGNSEDSSDDSYENRNQTIIEPGAESFSDLFATKKPTPIGNSNGNNTVAGYPSSSSETPP